MPSPPLTILTPLRAEAVHVRRALPGAPLRVIGPRGVMLPDPSSLAGNVVILAGFGGGLDPTLRCGDVLLDGAPADLPLRPGLVCGTVHTSEAIASDPARKAEIHADTGAMGVDMELAHVRRALTGVAEMILGVRAILDEASDPVPGWLMTAVNRRGGVRPGVIALRLLAHPGSMREMVTFARKARLAGRSLGAGVAHVAGWLAATGRVRIGPERRGAEGVDSIHPARLREGK